MRWCAIALKVSVIIKLIVTWVLLSSYSAFAYEGNLKYVICDIKRPLAGEVVKAITANNYIAILNGMTDKLNCNGIRIYIDPNVISPEGYPRIYQDVYKYAKEHGMMIYANPLGVGRHSMSNSEYAYWVSSYANYYKPDFLGVFNESAMKDVDMQMIMGMVRRQLSYRPKLVGPDKDQVQRTIQAVEENPRLLQLFDILGSHNAGGDDLGDQNATLKAWRRLVQDSGGRPIWASENPRRWVVNNLRGEEVGTRAIVQSGVEGIVIYMAFPEDVDGEGRLTQRGKEIVDGIGAR